MSTNTPTREETVTEHRGRRFRWLWVLALVVVVAIAGVVAWQVSGDDESTTEGVSAEIEAEIIALIDAWYAAWNENDGQAAVDLFADEGRYVYYFLSAPGQQPLDGLSGEDLETEVDEAGPIDHRRSGNPLIIVRDNSNRGRPDSYRVAQVYRHGEFGYENLHLFNIVDVDGTLRIRYLERWAENGWFRLTEDQPYQGTDGGE